MNIAITTNLKDCHVAGIGASAGGLSSIITFFQHLPSNTQVAYVVILHLPKDYESKLVELVQMLTTMPVHYLNVPQQALPNHVYVLPAALRVDIVHGILIPQLRGEEKINKVIDEFFLSLAEDKKEKAIGIILSGAGSDGAKGVQAIHKQGGTVLVEKPSTAEFSDMPEAAIKQNRPDRISSPAILAHQLTACLNRHARGFAAGNS